MPVYSGNISKMRVAANPQHQVQYQLPIGEQLIDMNALLGTNIHVEYAGEIHCTHCNKKTKKSFQQGYCYPCFMSLAQCDTCIIKPELCHYHQGTCREPEWGEANCLSDHYVYLSNTGNVKVGITRHVSDKVSSRWIDQGATQAMAIIRVQNRLISGLVETVLKQYIGDKTNWRTMLKGVAQAHDLVELKQHLLAQAEAEFATLTQEHGLQCLHVIDAAPVDIHYPVNQYPDKIKSINLDKTPEFSGRLNGIKGQYWLLDGDRVINMRKYTGYHLNITTE